MEFTDNQKDKITAALNEAFDITYTRQWQPGVVATVDGVSIQISADRTLKVSNKIIEGDWKGHSVDEDIVSAISWELQGRSSSSSNADEAPEEEPARTPLSERMPPKKVAAVTTLFREDAS